MARVTDYVLKCALAKDYAPLCFQLRSGNPLDADLREFLASFLEGKRHETGRGATPRKAWAERRHYRLFYWLTKVEGHQPDYAYDYLAEIHKISRRTAIAAVKAARESGHAAEVDRQEELDRQMLEESEDDPELHAVLLKTQERRREEVLSGEYSEFGFQHRCK